MATDRDDKLTRLRLQLRSETPREWWWWDLGDIYRDPSARTVRSMAVDLPWPYLRPTDLIPGPWWVRELSMQRLNPLIDGAIDQGIREERRRRLPGEPLAYQRPTVELTDRSIGSMVCVGIEWWWRSPRRVRMTPPIYKFCDLDTGFPNARDILKPFDFWIQPDVFHATGEVLHGGIAHNARTTDADIAQLRHIPRPQRLRSLLNEEREFAEELEFVHVALDAWLEDYERTGDTQADPRFAWTWAEERERERRGREQTCDFQPYGELRCGAPAAWRARLPTMQGNFGVFCNEHIGNIISDHPDAYSELL